MVKEIFQAEKYDCLEFLKSKFNYMNLFEKNDAYKI